MWDRTDCDVTSPIKDFAWHPRGRFIAVAADEDNVRIIDIDEVRLVDGISANRLVGWGPDGKILVGQKGDGELLIWDGLETKEKPLPEAIKSELWFKRFFNNISADGLRYIEDTDIFSTETGDLLASLPVTEKATYPLPEGGSTGVKSAAWSHIDGSLLAVSYGMETQIWKLRP